MSFNVRVTVHTDHGRGGVVLEALQRRAAEHLRSEPEVTVDPCRGDRVELLTDNVRAVASVARAAESSVFIIGSPSYV